MSWLSVYGDLRSAFSLLTRLPIRHDAAPQARGAWAYPVVGIAVGALGAAVFALLRIAGAPASLAAIWSLAATILVTGALHEDGLADTADGFGGGGTRARKLEIMRDSRIGSFGAIALILALGARVGALAALDRPRAAAAAIVAAATLGRAAIVVPLALLAPARTDGLASPLATPPPAASAIALLLAATIAFALLPTLTAAAALAAAGLAAVALASLARHQIGGYTGDVLGAVEQVAECAALTALAALTAG